MVRKFRIWKIPGSNSRWVWSCTLCQPAAWGSRMSWEALVGSSLPCHMEHRRGHHEWVRLHHLPRDWDDTHEQQDDDDHQGQQGQSEKIHEGSVRHAGQ